MLLSPLLSRCPVMCHMCGQYCRYCGTRSALTIDHVVPLSKGGKWVWENLVTACTKCNGKKGSKSLKQLGWKLKQKPKVQAELTGTVLIEC